MWPSQGKGQWGDGAVGNCPGQTSAEVDGC